ncbi:MAG TPA: DUF1634 domain-containing protein [Kofleriaceae bacterium]|nr:DUF1634 domain-containing protein [Kofleriaceae bacterium]
MTGLEKVLARVLGVGTALASALIGLGIVAGVPRLVTAGIAAIIALPAIRVAIMLGAFVRARDGRAAAIALAVLAILALGVLVGR